MRSVFPEAKAVRTTTSQGSDGIAAMLSGRRGLQGLVSRRTAFMRNRHRRCVRMDSHWPTSCDCSVLIPGRLPEDHGLPRQPPPASIGLWPRAREGHVSQRKPVRRAPAPTYIPRARTAARTASPKARHCPRSPPQQYLILKNWMSLYDSSQIQRTQQG